MTDDLEVLLYGHPTLRVRCAPVENFDDGLRALAHAMERTMIVQRGIGLAAPQVGREIRMLLAEDSRRGAPRTLVMVNPTITFASRERDAYEEGCLSLPELFADVNRPVRIRVRYQDLEGREQELEDDGMLARIVQHEADHLDGVLFVDHLSLIKRKLLAGRLKDLQRRARDQQQRLV
jgi:peptide deformylase